MKIKGSISREEALKNAPAHDDQFFKVPEGDKKIIRVTNNQQYEQCHTS